MQTWSITLHGPAGVIRTVDSGESQFAVGTETASDVFTVSGDGVTARHAWVWISEAGLQVEDLGGGTLVNGCQITERVQVEYPASVQVGEVTLVIELKRVEPAAVAPTPSSMDITIPQRAVTKSKASIEVTIPQRMPTRSNVRKNIPTASASAEPTAANKAPLTGEYTLVKEIARGGMGQIYFGEDPQLERQVAVKVSSVSEAGEDPRFLKEAKVLAQLAHPNIVPIYNIGVDAQSRPFYSMKLIKGRTLQAVLNLIRDGDSAAIKEYPRATLLTIFRKVCDAMMFAHSKGILHRDLKPENIMVGEYGEVLVMDWGLAKVLGEREDNVSTVSKVNDTGDYGMTMEGEVMGTPQYMSPEQAMGMVAELDARSDIYSLGGILYAILTLRPPIDGTTLDEVLTKVKNGSISSMVTKRGGKGGVTVGTPTAMGAEVPEALQAVTLKAMATDRNKRYASVELFAGDIERYQNGFATQAEDAGSLRKFVLFVKRNKVTSSLAFAIVAGSCVFAVRLAKSEKTARSNERQAIEEREAARRSAAEAQIALAEGAYDSGDGDQLRRLLGMIPEDFRDLTWNYLQGRMSTEDLALAAPNQLPWSGLYEHPTDASLFVAVQPKGVVSSVDINSGEIRTLWNVGSPGGRPPLYVSISADGEHIALAYSTGRVEVRQLKDGKLEQVLDGLQNVVSVGMNSSTGLLLVERFRNSFKGEKLGTVSMYDWRQNSRLWHRENLLRTFYEFADGGQTVRMITCDGPEEVDSLTGKTLWKSPAGQPKTWIKTAFAFDDSANRQSTVVYTQNPSSGALTGHQWASGALLFTSYARTQGRYNFQSIHLMNAPKLLLSRQDRSENTSVIEMRQPSTGKLINTILSSGPKFGHAEMVVHRKAAAVGMYRDNILNIWRLRVEPPLARLVTGYSENVRPFGTGFRAIQWGPASNGLALNVWDATAEGAPRKMTLTQRLDATGVTDAHADPAGRRVVAGGVSGSIRGFEVSAEGHLKEIWGLPSSEIKTQRNGRILIHPARDTVWVRGAVLDSSTGRLLSITDPSEYHGVVSRDGCAWVGEDGLVEIAEKWNESAQERTRVLLRWETSGGKLLAKVPAESALCMCVSPDARWIAEAGSDRKIRIRDAETLRIHTEFRGHDAEITGIQWHPSLPFLVTSARDFTSRIWEIGSFKMLKEYRSEQSGKSYVEISADGKQLWLINDRGADVYEPKFFAR